MATDRSHSDRFRGPEPVADARGRRGRAASSAGPVGAGAEAQEVVRLERELRDQPRGRAAQRRCDAVEAKARAQSELHSGAVTQLDDYNARIHELRRQLSDVEHDKKDAEYRAQRAADLDERVEELTSENRRLEERITELCESPFISEAHAQADRKHQLESLRKADHAQKLQIRHLRETAQTHHAALLALKKQTKLLQDEKDKAAAEVNALRLKYHEQEAGTALLQDKMRLYAGEDGVDMDELERALTIVKRRTEPGARVDFDGLQKSDNELDGDATSLNPNELRGRLQKAHETNLQLQLELERAEKMLRVQMSINKDLHAEIEEAHASQAKDKRGCARRSTTWRRST